MIDPATGLHPYPDLSQIPWRDKTGDSSYNAQALTLKRSFSHGLLVAANCTWSSIDDTSSGSADGDSLALQNVSCIQQ